MGGDFGVLKLRDQFNFFFFNCHVLYGRGFAPPQGCKSGLVRKSETLVNATSI